MTSTGHHNFKDHTYTHHVQETGCSNPRLGLLRSENMALTHSGALLPPYTPELRAPHSNPVLRLAALTLPNPRSSGATSALPSTPSRGPDLSLPKLQSYAHFFENTFHYKPARAASELVRSGMGWGEGKKLCTPFLIQPGLLQGSKFSLLPANDALLFLRPPPPSASNSHYF